MLNRLFSNEVEPIRLIRDLGLYSKQITTIEKGIYEACYGISW